jgi:hypothetical protein
VARGSNERPIRGTRIVDGDILYVPDKYLGSTLNPNARTSIRRAESGETVHTNQRGWRVRVPRDEAHRAKIMIAGCSWIQGAGVEYEDSIAGRIEERLQTPIANIGVGSYSLLQIARRLEQEIGVAWPEVTIIAFGGWHVDRCVKVNAHAGILFRPILLAGQDGSGLVVREPKQLPARYIGRFVELKNKVYRGQSLSVTESMEQSLVRWAAKGAAVGGQRFIRKLFGLQRAERIDPRNVLMRHLILDHCLAKIDNICRDHGAKAMLFHLFDWRSVGKDRWHLDLNDREYLRSSMHNYDNIVYEPWDTMEAKATKYLAAQDAEITDYEGRIWWRDNNHPNVAGQDLIAESVIEGLNRNQVSLGAKWTGSTHPMQSAPDGSTPRHASRNTAST